MNTLAKFSTGCVVCFSHPGSNIDNKLMPDNQKRLAAMTKPRPFNGARSAAPIQVYGRIQTLGILPNHRAKEGTKRCL